MWKKVLAAGTAVLALGLVAPITSDYSYTGMAMACEEPGDLSTPGGIPFSHPLAYGSSIQRSQINHDGRVLMEASTYEVNLDPAFANDFPKLQESLEKLSADNWSYMRRMMYQWEPDLVEQYEQSKNHDWYKENSGPLYSYELSYSGLRADSAVFSCVGGEFIYLGGAHPVFYYKAHVFDSNTGKELKLNDIFKTTDGLAEIIVEETESQIEPKSSMPDKAEALKDIKQMIKDGSLQYGMTEDDFIVYFGNYAIGPYAMGTLEVKLPYKKYFKLFNNKYVFYGTRAKG
ncbi:RsiV family protein [Anaerovibrio sp. RM50]|uniref:RsiV family protein n=1 Tax=Anaerovibrio sp. RM50 TaxID=1200557 RepID=UPI0004837C77|nr:RsiV family protein [Anaerovibrio sp. RM50]